jgi:hypothetical protein
MCSKCQEILIGYAIPHPVTECPLLQSSYCSLCCSYGHLTEQCPDDPTLESRTISYVEQLIPWTLREQYKVTTQTPLGAPHEQISKFQPVLKVEKTNKAMRQVLMNYSIQPSGKIKENRRLLKILAENLGRKLEYVDLV